MTNMCHKDDIKLCNQLESKSEETTNLTKVLSKIITFLLLKIFVKHTITSRLKLIFNMSLYSVITIMTKTLTITLCKAIIRRALYPVLRTSVKTCLILSFKAILKPVFNPIIKLIKDSIINIQVIQYLTKKIVMLCIKIIIKTSVIEFIIFVFQTTYNDYTFGFILFRVSVILTLKMSVKEIINYYYKNKNKEISKQMKKNMNNSNKKILIYTLRKLTTKLLKIPIINFLL